LNSSYTTVIAGFDSDCNIWVDPLFVEVENPCAFLISEEGLLPIN